MLDVFSVLLRDLYRIARNATTGHARDLILRRIRTSLPFDSALWASGTVSDAGPVLHEFTVLDQPSEMMIAYDAIKMHDRVYLSAFENLGTTSNVDVFSPAWQAELHPSITAHCRRFGMAHILSTVDADLATGLFFAFSLYRADTERPFSDADRQLNQLLIPHLPELDAICHLQQVESRRRDGRESIRTYAVCDRHGYLRHADRAFAGLLRTEWPRWQGPRLPRELCDQLATTGRGEWQGGAAIVANWEPDQALCLLTVRKRSPLDRLSRRELEVTRAFAGGAEYSEIAQALRIAPATARNHLRNVYVKLGIHNKAELANTLRDVDG
jgi:DNA-binding CsgD family transcriptional regulator